MKYLIYAGVMLVAAAGLVLGLERMTRPPTLAETASTETNSAKPSTEPSLHTASVPDPGAVRKIPIVGTNPDDPNNDLTPIYPASPGEDLPPKKVVATDAPDKDAPDKDAPTKDVSAQNVVAAKNSASTSDKNTAKPPAVTNGSAPARDAAPATRTASAQTQSPDVCNIQACTSAYRSFRASDCSYQPYEGPRQLCTVDDDDSNAGNPDRRQQAKSNASSSPPARARIDDAELRAVEREVRRLPGPEYRGGDRGVVIYRDDGSRYSLRRNWIYDR